MISWCLNHIVAAAEFAPDFTIISAGFDAARGDPLGCCDVRTYPFTLSNFLHSHIVSFNKVAIAISF